MGGPEFRKNILKNSEAVKMQFKSTFGLGDAFIRGTVYVTSQHERLLKIQRRRHSFLSLVRHLEWDQNGYGKVFLGYPLL